MQRLFFLPLFLIVGLLTASPVFAAVIPYPPITSTPITPIPMPTSGYTFPLPSPIITGIQMTPMPPQPLTPMPIKPRPTTVPVITSTPVITKMPPKLPIIPMPPYDEIDRLERKISALEKRFEDAETRFYRLEKTLTAVVDWLRSRFPSFPLSK